MNRMTGFLMFTCAAALFGCATPAEGPAAAKPAATAANPDTVRIPYGYVKVLLHNGEERFCRNDLVPGSRTERTRVCLTAEQLKASQDNSQKFIQDVQQRGAGSTMTGMPGAGAMGR